MSNVSPRNNIFKPLFVLIVVIVITINLGLGNSLNLVPFCSSGTLFTNVCRSCATTAVLRRRRGSVVATIRLILDRRRKYSHVAHVRRRAYDLSRQLIYGSFAIYSTDVMELTGMLLSTRTIKVVLWRVIEV